MEIKRKRCEKRDPEDRLRKMRGNEREGEEKEKKKGGKKKEDHGIVSGRFFRRRRRQLSFENVV